MPPRTITPARVPGHQSGARETLRRLVKERSFLELAVANRQASLTNLEILLANDQEWLRQHAVPFLRALALNDLTVLAITKDKPMPIGNAKGPWL